MISKPTKMLDFLFKKLFDRNLWLLIIFILGLLLRMIGTNPGYLNHPDEPKIADAAMNIVLKLNFEPVAFYYGSLLPIIYAAVDFIILPFYIIFFVVFNIGTLILKKDPNVLECFTRHDFSYCLGIQSSNFFLYLTRYETAFLSSIAVILIYFLGKKLFNKEVGLIAAFFTAINYRHVLSSHFSLADAPLTVFIIISILFSLKILEKQSLKNYLLTGIAIGLTLSIKYFTYTIPTFLLVHILGNWKDKSTPKNLRLIFLDHKLYLSLFIALVIFFMINPYVIIDFQNAKEQYELNSMFYKTKDLSLNSFINFRKIPSYSIYYLYKYALGESLSIATVAGFFLSLLKYPRPTIILSSVIFPFFYVFLVISGATYVRNYAGIIPLLTFFPAILLLQIVSKITDHHKVKLLKIILISLGIFTLGISTFKNTTITSYAFSQTGNYALLEDWILKEIPDQSKIVKTWGTPFPGSKQVNLTEWIPYSTGYQSLSELTSLGIQHLILSTRSGAYINDSLNVTNRNDIIFPSFLDSKVFWSFLENNYASLLTRELSGYRVKEFVKPFESLDPSFVAIKIPYFDETSLKGISFSPNKPQIISECFTLDSRDESVMKIKSLKNSLKGLHPTQVVLGKLPIKENKLYKITGEAILDSNAINQSYEETQNIRSRFLRFDFFSSKGKVLKTIVSSQLKGIRSWGKLSALSLSPKDATYAVISFQLDECRKNENDIYLLKNIQIFESTENQEIDPLVYPYYNQQLLKSFIWLPPE